MPNSQLHHYVPRFLLRRFGTGKKHHLHTCDKSTGAVFSRAAGKLAASYDFYDFIFLGEPMSVEPALADVEAKAGAHIARIVKERSLNLSAPWERGELARFLAVQLVRTPAQRATSEEMFMRMEAWLRKEGMPEAYFACDPRVGGGENAERAAMARRIVSAPATFAKAFLDKDWVLFETEKSHPYLIGDHPLVMHNDRKSDVHGTLGLDVKGIEIYFPLSPELTLGMLCPSIGERLSHELASAGALAAGSSAYSSTSLEPVARLLSSIDTGSAFNGGSESSPFFNALQIANAERYVFSSDGNFDLLKKMIGADPDLKHGRRMREATGKF
jgi:hypothetical protein